MSKFCINKPDLIDNICRWRMLPKKQLPILPRTSTTANRIIAIGNDSNSSSENRRSEIYCPITNKWKAFRNFQCEQSGICSVVLGNEIYILGGFCHKSKEVKKSVGLFNLIALYTFIFPVCKEHFRLKNIIF